MRFCGQFEIASPRKLILRTVPPSSFDVALDVLHYANIYLTYLFAGEQKASIYAVNEYRVDSINGIINDVEIASGVTYLTDLFALFNELMNGPTPEENRLMHGHYRAKWLGQKGKEFIMSVEATPEPHGLKLSILTEIGMAAYREQVLIPFTMVVQSDLAGFQKLELRKDLEQIFIHHLNGMALTPLREYMATLTSPLTAQSISASLPIPLTVGTKTLVEATHEAIVNLYSIIWQILEGYRLTAVNPQGERITDYVPSEFDSTGGQVVLIYLPT